jgi:drug/metabolite transporter (DMT)-like permease
MVPVNILGITLALISAAVWGGGDFAGGFASRRSSPFYVLALAALSGLLILLIATVLWRETLPSARGILMAALGGIAGALGIAAFYRALSFGHFSIVAPTTGVISAVLPVLIGITIQGLPAVSKLIGFGLALAGIWLVSSASGSESRISSRELVLAVLAGVGFGGFLTFLGLVDPGKIFTPLIISRSMTLCVGLLLIKLNRMPFPALTSNPMALLAGVLDAGGNLFYILARQFTRLDIAAVLSSLYPASTVILAGIILKERMSFRQGVGVAACLAAILLIVK